MQSGWRMVRAARVADAFTGEGARLFSGRWNSRGVRMVYASEHQSLAALEILVHRWPVLALEKYKAFPLRWDRRLVETISVDKLPSDWRAYPAPPATKAIGDRWMREGRSAVVAVPSVLAPADRNFLLNPAHPKFGQIEIGAPIDFVFDHRLVNR